MYSSTPLLVALATFGCYTLTGHHLDVASALTALALFDILRFPLFMLPQIINRMIEASISFERVREFLLSEEYMSVGEGDLEKEGEVWIKNGTFVYDSKKPRLNDDDGDKKGSKKPNSGGGGAAMRDLMHQHHRIMQEAALDRQWEKVLLQAQLLDAEKRIDTLEKELRHDKDPYSENELGNEEGGKWSPSSLLSLRRVSMHCQPGEFVAVVGGVGAGKVSDISGCCCNIHNFSPN